MYQQPNPKQKDETVSTSTPPSQTVEVSFEREKAARIEEIHEFIRKHVGYNLELFTGHQQHTLNTALRNASSLSEMDIIFQPIKERFIRIEQMKENARFYKEQAYIIIQKSEIDENQEIRRLQNKLTLQLPQWDNAHSHFTDILRDLEETITALANAIEAIKKPQSEMKVK